jgi:hypothetical protein
MMKRWRPDATGDTLGNSGNSTQSGRQRLNTKLSGIALGPGGHSHGLWHLREEPAGLVSGGPAMLN